MQALNWRAAGALRPFRLRAKGNGKLRQKRNLFCLTPLPPLSGRAARRAMNCRSGS
jgi:hypothetical protein